MKLVKGQKLEWEKDEPNLRSCWKCNSSHKSLKKVNTLHRCFLCGRQWIYDKFFDSLYNKKDSERECEKKIYDWLRKQGLKDGDSTRKIDKGYRIYQITITPKDVKK